MKILIIEDNHKLRSMLATFLQKENYQILEAGTGEKGLELFLTEEVDLVLLDIMLPNMGGLEVCQKIRLSSMVPIIMITAKSEDHDKILGLDVGADDYMVKPFSHQEVAARIRAIMRRLEPKNPGKQELVGLTVDMTTYKVYVFEEEKHLTKKEFELLIHFMMHPNHLFSRDHLLDTVWGMDYFGDFRTVDSHIKRLREKLKVPNEVNWKIKTVWGKGYLLEVNEHES